MAPKKKPSELKKAEGTYRKDKDGSSAPPNNEYGLPQAPSWLSKRAKSAYRDLANDLHKMGVVTKEDKHQLSIICQEYAQYVQMQEMLEREGFTYWTYTTDGNAIQKKHYEADMAQQKAKFVNDQLSKFGLDPSNRHKVSRIDDQASEDPLEAHLKKN